VTRPRDPRPGRLAARGGSRRRPRSAFEVAWAALYELFYFLLECLTRMLFRPLFLVRRVRGSGTLPPGGVLVCANHQSYLDPAFVQLAVSRRLTFLMTTDFYDVPLARSFFMLCGAVPVAPGTRGARASVRRARSLLRLGRAVVVFPEGRISPPGTLGRLHRGVAVLAREAGVPVVPVAVAGSARAWPKGGRRFRRADVRVAVGAPFAYEGPDAREGEAAFLGRLEREVAALWASIPGPTRGTRPAVGEPVRATPTG
jgi:1-acyl-sn-glycerol-3-phosphate acyltransferase